MSHHEDSELRSAFERLRAAEEAVAPDFSGMLSAAEAETGPTLVRLRRRRTVRWMSGGAGLATAATIAGILLTGLRAEASFESAVESLSGTTQWSSSTDFLMDVHGSELMHMPTFTSSRVWVGLADAGLPLPTSVGEVNGERNRS